MKSMTGCWLNNALRRSCNVCAGLLFVVVVAVDAWRIAPLVSLLLDDDKSAVILVVRTAGSAPSRVSTTLPFLINRK